MKIVFDELPDGFIPIYDINGKNVVVQLTKMTFNPKDVSLFIKNKLEGCDEMTDWTLVSSETINMVPYRISRGIIEIGIISFQGYAGDERTVYPNWWFHQ